MLKSLSVRRSMPMPTSRRLSIRSLTITKAKKNEFEPPEKVSYASLTFFAGISAALLGPICDSAHSSNDVLHYTSPTITYPIETCFWVPPLFAIAAIILSCGHVYLDRLWAPHNRLSTFSSSSSSSSPALASTSCDSDIDSTCAPSDSNYDSESEEDSTPVPFFLDRPRFGYDPSWPIVLSGIAIFCLQYAFSGRFEATLGLESPVLYHAILLSSALALWYGVDGTRQGLLWGVLTAVGGPIIEVVLINQLGLYHYEHPDLLGIPLWIPWVYFAGSPANGNLGRKIAATLSRSRSSEAEAAGAAGPGAAS